MELGKKQLNYRYFFKSSLGLTIKLVSHAPFRVPRLIPSFLENSNIAFTSFGKQSPPNPNLPSGPGTCICECPILPSLTQNPQLQYPNQHHIYQQQVSSHS